MSRITRKCTSIILTIAIISVLYVPSLIVGKDFRLVAQSLAQENNTDYRNTQPLLILNLPQAYLTYGDDGFTNLGFKGVTVNKTMIENPDFSFPLINEGVSLRKGMSFHIPTVSFIGNKSIQVKNVVTVIPILKQDKHGNFDIHNLGNESVVVPNRRNVDGNDDFILNNHVKSGESYILSIYKIFNDGIVSIYQTRLAIN
jgi:hypothetical protein